MKGFTIQKIYSPFGKLTVKTPDEVMPTRHHETQPWAVSARGK